MVPRFPKGGWGSVTWQHARTGSIWCNLNRVLPSRAVFIRNYLAMLTELGARTRPHVELPPRSAWGPNLLDSESSSNGILLSAREEQLGDASHTC